MIFDADGPTQKRLITLPRRCQRQPLSLRERSIDRINRMLAQGRLTPRDQQVVRSVWTFGALTAHQLQRLHFPQHTFANLTSAQRVTNRRLTQLYRWHFLDRAATSLAAPYIYILDEQGGRLMQIHLGAQRLRQVWKRTQTTQALLFLDHRLEIAGFAIQLKETLRLIPDANLTWLGEHQLRLVTRDGTTFWPDGGIILSFVGHTPLTLLLEWDRGRETIAVIGRKLRNYLACRSFSDGWQHLFNHFPPLLIVTTGGPRRRDNMLREASRQLQLRGATDFVVLVTAATDLNLHGVFAEVFHQAGQPEGRSPVSLLGNANQTILASQVSTNHTDNEVEDGL